MHEFVRACNVTKSYLVFVYQAGAQIPDPVVQVFNGQEVEVWPRITWKPKWALIFSDVKTKVNSGCSISQQSSMIINGQNVFLQDLSLDGALVINSVDEAEVFHMTNLLNTS